MLTNIGLLGKFAPAHIVEGRSGCAIVDCDCAGRGKTPSRSVSVSGNMVGIFFGFRPSKYVYMKTCEPRIHEGSP